MRYEIDLTDREAKVLKSIIGSIGENILGEDNLFRGKNIKQEEIIPLKETEAYKQGFREGTKWAIDENAKDHQGYYTKGYNTAISDYNAMIQWLHDCTDNFKEFLNEKFGYDIVYLTNPKVDEGVILYDLICDHDIAEVISEFKKWQEEKKKTEEEIKVGDEVYLLDKYHPIVVTAIDDDNIVCLAESGKYSYFVGVQRDRLTKTGRHFEEVETLLDKLIAESEG